jgi:hypothetical protein
MGGAYIKREIRHAQKIGWDILKGREGLAQLGVNWKISLNRILIARLNGMDWIQPTQIR